MKKSFQALNQKKSKDTSCWKLTYNHFDPVQEGLRESLCTLGNGYFGVRGAVIETPATRINYPGMYMAGVFNKIPTPIAGKNIYNEDFVNCPNWLILTFKVGTGNWNRVSLREILSYEQVLNMQSGILTRKYRIQDQEGHRTTVETHVIASMADPHCGAIKYTIIPENYDDTVTVRSVLDGTVQNTGVPRYKELNSQHLTLDKIGRMGKNGVYLSVKTSRSRVIIVQASIFRVFKGASEIHPAVHTEIIQKKKICQELHFHAQRKKKYTFEKSVSIYTSRDKNIRNPLKAACDSVKKAPRFDQVFNQHKKTWRKLWKMFDIEISGDTFSERVLRLHTFHLLQTASIHNQNIDAGLPARGLHGESYRGHIFWDEIFVMSFFYLQEPLIAKALLMYRYNRLPEARKYAAKNKYRGSMFPWQSGSTGVEETQTIHLNPISGKWGPDFSCIQRHISFDIAYNVWQFWKHTNDIEFLYKYGAELILSIAQFGGSLAYYDKKDDAYHTKGIMGPDEFHERLPLSSEPGVKDNAYSNMMIVWTLLKAQEVLQVLSPSQQRNILKKVGVNEQELKRWDDITRKMNIVMNDDNIISQFDGYFDLKELDWESYRTKYGNIHRMDRILKSEGKSPDEYKLAKQADVLMLFYLFPLDEVKELFERLGYQMNINILRKNYDYYEKRTSHGSTLSMIVHCYIAYMLGRVREGWSWYTNVLKSDLNDTQGGTTAEGIHTGVMGGSIDIAMRRFAGIDIRYDHIKVDPHLPRLWNSVRVQFIFKGTVFIFTVTKSSLTIEIRSKKTKRKSFPLEVQGKSYRVLYGAKRTIPLKKK
ncbi:MAG: glycosyl hydrolase family 65 protein [Candidatus Ancaeobacter aquaticus]|nr:glycosyl hydrolase family 65 protein [Candidatus Ancaeobacter aquaticus]